MESILIKKTDNNITVCESIAQELKRRYHIQNVEIIRNVPGLQIIRNTPRLHNMLGIKESNRIILYIGGITVHRGLEELIQSIVYLKSCVVVFMGYARNTKYREDLEQLARDIGVKNKIYFFGPVSSDEVISYASSADIGVAPIKNVCLSYFLCLPNKFFEYIAAGLPVACSNFPELKRVIEGYNLGSTFDPDDPKNIARSISYVLSDYFRYDRMKKNSIKAAEIFNWENESKKFLTIYRNLRTI